MFFIPGVDNRCHAFSHQYRVKLNSPNQNNGDTPPNNNNPIAAGAPGGRWGSIVFGWRAVRPPSVVFVLGCVSHNMIHQVFSNENRAFSRPLIRYR